MRRLIYTAVVAISIFSTAPASAQAVVNGGFETGDLTGWTRFGFMGGTGAGVCGGGCAESGGFGAFLGGVGTPGGIEQSLATVSGQTYTISFWLLNNGGTPSSFTANFGGTTLLSMSDPPAFGYTAYSFDATASSTATLLQFSGRNDPAYFYLDNISVQSATAAVPESSTWAMMLLGFGTTGFALRRKRRLSVNWQRA